MLKFKYFALKYINGTSKSLWKIEFKIILLPQTFEIFAHFFKIGS